MSRGNVWLPLREAMKAGAWERAAALAAEGVRNRPLDPQGWVSLAEAYIALGRGEAGQAALRRGRLLDPEGHWYDPLSARAKSAARVETEAKPRAETFGEHDASELLRVPAVTVCAAILARNEERCIARCLDSLQGAVDEIAVLDTGSTDRTKDIVRGYPNVTLLETTWKDSFAAARNEALQHLRSDWVLWIDADEWLHPDDRDAVREIAGLFDRSPKPPILQIWHLNLLGADTQHDFSQSRMFPLRRGLRFFGRIHNQVAGPDGVYGETPLLRRKVGLRLYHDGYAPEVTKGKRKSARAERLIALSRAEDPRNPAWPYFLGRERFAQGRFEEAETTFAEALRLSADVPRFARTLELRLWLARCAFALKRWDAVRERCERILAEAPNFPDAHYYLAQAKLMQAKERFREAETLALGAAESAKSYRGTVAADRSIREWRAPVLLADLAVHRGRLAEARAIYRAYAKKAGPHEGAVKKKLAFIERQRKKLEQAGRAPKPE